MRFQKHVFVCTNQRVGSDRPSCGEACGLELVKQLKGLLKERGLAGKIRAQRAGCLDACEHGPAMVVYPEGVFYGGVNAENLVRIADEHLVAGRPVDELMIRFEDGSDGSK
ncbi:MAG: (2Fe-2S) ferredoxin domain-containing protein [Bacteroidota bacterium]